MGLLSWLTGGTETANKAIETVSAGVDMMFYTDEEKAIANQKILDFKLKWIQASSGQNLARRYIAFGIVGLWVLLVVMAVAFKLLGGETQSAYLFQVLSEVVNSPFMIIIGFYFAAHLARGLKG